MTDWNNYDNRVDSISVGSDDAIFSRAPSRYMMSSLERIYLRCLSNTSFSSNQMRAFYAFKNNYSKTSNRKRQDSYDRFGVAAESYVLGITNRCNLDCMYCYSSSGNDDFNMIGDNIAFAIINELKEALGIYIVTISGGEPFPYVLDLAAKHKDIVFYTYSNGTLITRDIARQLKELGNIIPSISIVGKKETHESIRGVNTYNRMINGVENLIAESILWGFSVTESQANLEEILNGAIFNQCSPYKPFFMRMMPYVCEGREVTSLSLSKSDRNALETAIVNAKKDREFIIYDYVNDRSLGIGCMAGGNRYFYISPDLKLTPCVFMDVGDKILYDPINRKTNVVQLLKSSMPLMNARKLRNSCESCIVQEKHDWKRIITEQLAY